ncbi:MAG TPA: hypothetical protein VMV23_10310 [Candidatus Nanopelagicaceae bacterium]|nr:hypothetical protein [Candidatus Nanopelagicaceae bacterium]
MKLVIRPIRQAAKELAAVTEEPVPTSLATYFDVRSLAFPDRPTLDRLPVSVRLAAVGNEIKSRLTLMSDVLRRLEVLEWEVRVVGDDVVVSTPLSVEAGWQKLREDGVSDHLLPMLQRGSDLPPRPRARTGSGPPPAA